jgi:hypothetical protein
MAAWDLGRSSAFERAAQILAMVPEVPDDGYGANFLHTYLRAAQAQEATNKAAYAGWHPGQPPKHPTSYEPQRQLVSALQTSLRVQGLDLEVAGVKLRTANIDLNTALIAGSDPVALAAKIHGWCESHCWIEGPDREWLAEIIDEGVENGLFRRGFWYADTPDGPKDKWSSQGWEEVLTLLRSRDDEPVVLSYSVSERFPNEYIAGWDGPEDSWYDLPDAEQWERALTGLREQRPWARLAPDTLYDVTFGPPVTVYDLLAPDRDERVRGVEAARS